MDHEQRRIVVFRELYWRVIYLDNPGVSIRPQDSDISFHSIVFPVQMHVKFPFHRAQ